MAVTPTLADEEKERLRQKSYNAELTDVIVVNDDLRIFRVVPDRGVPAFEPGQYTVLGLGFWEPRHEHIPDVLHDDAEIRKVCKRAYSMSCPLVDEQGRLLPTSRCSFLEFYVVLLRTATDGAPALTPRLFSLRPGDRLFIGPKATGHYTLRGVQPDDDCIFVATGTGEAPHNVMVASLLDNGHRGRIVSITCMRYRRDLAYANAHRVLEEKYTNYRYASLTTREPENLEPSVPGYIGKRYPQDYFDSGDFERELDLPLDPVHTHVFLCGNPAMIGAPIRTRDGEDRFPEPRGMIEVLHARGFKVDSPREPANIHFEKYW